MKRRLPRLARAAVSLAGGTLAWLLLAGQVTPPPGWGAGGKRTAGYAVRLDPAAGRNGGGCALIDGWSPGPDSFASFGQGVDAAPYAGRKARFAAWVRAEAVVGWSGLYMRFDDPEGKPVAFDNMQERPIRGSVEWHRYEIVLEVPRSASSVSFGALLAGRGKVWVDDASLDVAAPDAAVTAPSFAEIRERRAKEEKKRSRSGAGNRAETRSKAEPAPKPAPAPKAPRESPGWQFLGHPDRKAKEYEAVVEHEDEAGGLTVAIRNLVERPRGYLSVVRWSDGRKLVGRRVRFSALIRSEDLDGWTGLWMRVDDASQRKVLGFDGMQRRPITGTRDWRRYEVVLDVEPGAVYVFFGLIVEGKGKVWMKDVEIGPVEKDVPLTAPPSVRPGPVNLDFELSLPKPSGGGR